MNTATAPPRLTLKAVSLFFFPLLLNVQLMSVSHSIINAALARQHDYITALAAFSLAMVVHLFFASPSYQNHTITITMVRGRRSLRGVILFILLVATWVSIMLWLIALTPLGDWLLGTIIGVDRQLIPQTKAVVSFFALLPFITGFRGLFQGLVIRARRTGLVSLATGVRIAALSVYLPLGMHFFNGPSVGGFALVACVATETVLMAFFAWRVHLPLDSEEDKEGEKGAREIIRFAFPLAYSSGLQQAIPLLISAIIGRLPDGALALAGFGVIRGFLFLLAGPMRNLQQAYLTLVRDAAEYRVLVSFFQRTAAVMGLMMVLTAYPLNELVLGRIMGIGEELRHSIALPMAACTIFPLLYGAANLLRGFFAGAHRTPLLGRSTIYKALYLAICLGFILLISAELFEAWYLLRQRRALYPEWGRLPVAAKQE